jgi:hypothetical protein
MKKTFAVCFNRETEREKETVKRTRSEKKIEREKLKRKSIFYLSLCYKKQRQAARDFLLRYFFVNIFAVHT